MAALLAFQKTHKDQDFTTVSSSPVWHFQTVANMFLAYYTGGTAISPGDGSFYFIPPQLLCGTEAKTNKF